MLTFVVGGIKISRFVIQLDRGQEAIAYEWRYLHAHERKYPHNIGFVPPDETWLKMKAVYDACTRAGVAVPKDVEEFFGYKVPDDAGVQIELPLTEWSEFEIGSGFELEVSKIPQHVKVIRFYEKW